MKNFNGSNKITIFVKIEIVINDAGSLNVIAKRENGVIKGEKFKTKQPIMVANNFQIINGSYL